ncbi:MAG: chemotaxis-specific protein-glutamate methyltransferase CheB [Gemmatimonadaceae bacterium]
MIRVLVAEDSPTARALLVAMMSADPEIEIVAEAKTGLEAVEMAERLRPDLITMDVQMPELDGLEATERIMASAPCPILIVSSKARESDISLSLDATRAGALLVLPKPEGPLSSRFEGEKRHLVSMVKALSRVKVVRRRGSSDRSGTPRTGRREASTSEQQGTRRARPRSPATLVAVGSSTGGPAALHDMVLELPRDFRAPILVVQHIARGFVNGLAKWLGDGAGMRVKVATDGEIARPGTMYIADDDKHLGVHKDAAGGYRIALSRSAPAGTFRPSATRLFESAAEAAGENLVAVILTGMGDDGVEGLSSVKNQRGMVIAQDEESSVIYGMPREAVRAGVVNQVLPLHAISGRLVELT